MKSKEITMTIGQLALEMPNAISVLDRLDVDYSCRGSESVADACERAGITVDELWDAVNDPSSLPSPRDWKSEPLSAIQAHIVATHHRFTREALETVGMLAEKVAHRHGVNHPEVLRVLSIVDTLRAELIPHMAQEEKELFPLIVGLETATAWNPDAAAVGNPLLRLRSDHETTFAQLTELRRITSGYQLPPDACLSFRALYERLIELDEDLHAHMQLEHDLLFPRASALAEAKEAGR